MSTYYSRANSYSRSYNAQCAEAAGREPASRAAKTWGFKSAKDLRAVVSTSEWHHVGKYANVVDYFDVQSWIDNLTELSELEGIAKHLTKTGKATTLRDAVHSIIIANLAASTWHHDFKSSRNPRFSRIAKLASVHNLPTYGVNWPVNLSDASAASFAATYHAEQAIKAKAAKIAAFRARLTAQMLPAKPPATHRIPWDARIAQLKTQLGDWHSRMIVRKLRGRALPLTAANWSAIRSNLEANR
jgi:hypothetical protein